jgi:hypothetical protein
LRKEDAKELALNSFAVQQLKNIGVMSPAHYFLILEQLASNNNIRPRTLIPAFLHRKVINHSPIRAKPQKTYDKPSTEMSTEGDHTPYLLREIFRKDPWKKLLIDRFGVKSGLFEKYIITDYDNRKKASNLDYESPFEIDFTFGSDSTRSIIQVGYGVSQVLPIVVSIINEKDVVHMVQQPEVHLHPKAQAALGEFFYEQVKGSKRQLIVETHSDFIIDRFRRCYGKGEGKEMSCQILYFERKESGNKVTSIEILENGEYSLDQPKGFREFFLNEAYSALGF